MLFLHFSFVLLDNLRATAAKKYWNIQKKNRYSIERSSMLIWCIEDMKRRYVEIMQIRLKQTHAMVQKCFTDSYVK